MKYKLLSHLFYKNKDEYNALYQQRMSSESTVVLPIKIGELAHDFTYDKTTAGGNTEGQKTESDNKQGIKL